MKKPKIEGTSKSPNFQLNFDKTHARTRRLFKGANNGTCGFYIDVPIKKAVPLPVPAFPHQIQNKRRQDQFYGQSHFSARHDNGIRTRHE